MGKYYFKISRKTETCATKCKFLKGENIRVGSMACGKCPHNEDDLFPHPPVVDVDPENDQYVECAKIKEINN